MVRMRILVNVIPDDILAIYIGRASAYSFDPYGIFPDQRGLLHPNAIAMIFFFPILGMAMKAYQAVTSIRNPTGVQSVKPTDT